MAPRSPLDVATLPVGELEANCYILSARGSPDAMVVDAGGDSSAIAEHMRSRSLAPVLLVSTHAYADHIAGAAELLDEFPGLQLAAHEAEADWYSRPSLNLSYFLGRPVKCPAPGRLLADGDALELADRRIEVLHLPGHSPGSIGLLFDGAPGRTLISGDTLFAGGVGRTDLHGGDGEVLMRSLARIMELPDETVVFPGHGPATTVGEERRNNPFLAG